MTWTTRPPQYRFDGNTVRNAIKAEQLRKLEAAGTVRYETAAERAARMKAERAEAEIDPDAPLWQERARRVAARCKDTLGDAYHDFMAQHAEQFEVLTWRQLAEGFERLAVRTRFLVPPDDTLDAIFSGRL